jgi:hypothetical protein
MNAEKYLFRFLYRDYNVLLNRSIELVPFASG